MRKYWEYILLTIIFILAVFLRVYKLDLVPPSLNWDETAAGYNAYTIANWGTDEYGNKFPLVFKSFGDDKHPVHIYITAVFVKLFGLNEVSTRLPSALVGSLTVPVIYFLVKKMFRNKIAGIFSALFLAVSPYHLQFSRGLWEANFALFFYILGMLLFYVGIERKKWVMPLSFFSFGLSFFSYHASKVIVPPTILLLVLLHFKEFIKNKSSLIFSGLVLLIFTILTVKNPAILGFARIDQNKISKEKIENTFLYGKTKSSFLGTAELTFNNYKTYFYPNYLFVNGDVNPRNSVNAFGQFYKIDAVLILIGIVSLILMRSKESLVLAAWLLLAPIPAAFAGGPQNAVRAIFMLGSINILAGLGASRIVTLFKNKIWYALGCLLILIPLFWETGKYLTYYYKEYATKYAIEWQYGMKQIVEYVKDNPRYIQVYMDKIRQQPYIFFLYYLKTPVPELLETVRYDQSASKSYNTVVSFDKYQFGGNWNIIESYPTPGILYIMTPSFYTGLRYGNRFEVKDLVKYPDGTDAFYIIEGKK